ncbi:MAG: Gx transporter family protein [Spirochaetales bacterium]|nr:Gx transporter family protein [Spirochaetales bacterium]
MQSHSKKELVYLLAGSALFLSVVEILIPKPVPFMRLGLANISIILGIYLLGFSYTFLLVLFKTLVQGVLSGTILSFAFGLSISGSLASFFVMYLLYRFFKERLSLVAISCAGAFFSNLAQLTLSYLFIFGKASFVFAPLLFLSGFVASIVIGVFSVKVINYLES